LGERSAGKGVLLAMRRPLRGRGVGPPHMVAAAQGLAGGLLFFAAASRPGASDTRTLAAPAFMAALGPSSPGLRSCLPAVGRSSSTARLAAVGSSTFAALAVRSLGALAAATALGGAALGPRRLSARAPRHRRGAVKVALGCAVAAVSPTTGPAPPLSRRRSAREVSVEPPPVQPPAAQLPAAIWALSTPAATPQPPPTRRRVGLVATRLSGGRRVARRASRSASIGASRTRESWRRQRRHVGSRLLRRATAAPTREAGSCSPSFDPSRVRMKIQMGVQKGQHTVHVSGREAKSTPSVKSAAGVCTSRTRGMCGSSTSLKLYLNNENLVVFCSIGGESAVARPCALLSCSALRAHSSVTRCRITL